MLKRSICLILENILKMIKKFTPLLLLIVSVTNAESIQDYCKSIVGESYSLMEVCVNQEIVARSGVLKRTIEPKIELYCESIASGSYSLQETCINQEERAKQNVSSMYPSNTVMSYCKSIVGDSYSLLETCIKQEQGAKTRLTSVSNSRWRVSD